MLVWCGKVEVGVEEDGGVGFDVEVEETGVDEEGFSWAMTVRVDEVEEEVELSWACSLPLLLVVAPVFEWADESKEAAFVNALKEHPTISFVISDGDTPFSFSSSFSSPLSLSLLLQSLIPLPLLLLPSLLRSQFQTAVHQAWR